MRAALVSLIVGLVTVKLLVWWLEPRMAFFPFRGVQDTPASVGLAFTDHRIPTTDGETLHAWWLEHPKPRGQVIYWHGNGGNLSLWLDVFVELRRRGFSVFAADYRGYGASSGRPSEKGIYNDGDAATAYFDTRLRAPSVPVIFWGRSLGCAVAARASLKSHPGALILESPFPDVATLFAGNPVMRFLSLFSTYSFQTSRYLKTYDGLLLILHGDADSIIPFKAGRRVFDNAPAKQKTFVAIAGADHNDNHAGNTEYWKAIDTFVASVTSAAR